MSAPATPQWGVTQRESPALEARPDGPGLSPHARMLYRALALQCRVSIEHVERLMGRPMAQSAPLAELRQLGLVRQGRDGILAIPRRQVIDDLLQEQASMLSAALAQVIERQHQIARLTAEADSLDFEPEDHIHTLSSESGVEFYPGATQAKTDLMALHPGGQFEPMVLEQSLDRAKRNLAEGIRLRVVHQVSALAHPASVDYLTALERLGGRVRVRENLPFRLLLIDQAAAVCAAPVGETDETYLLRGRRVLTLLSRVFESTWADSTPLGAALNATPEVPSGAPLGVLHAAYAQLSSQQRTILTCLAEGDTDSTIARRLGVTGRTVTRRISQIYQVLGVDSRFQAGVVAQRLGLI